MLSLSGQANPTHRLVMLLFFFVLANPSLFSQTLTVLHAFDGSDGQYPQAALTLDSAGNLYGTTSYGGAGYGTIFKLDPEGNYSVLYRFAGGPNDGAYPGALVRDTAGNLYGTTSQGGTASDGTLFKLDASGNETVLHNFGANSSDGMEPNSGLIQDRAGNLYGTTVTGGLYNGGTVFEWTVAGKEKVLFNFDGLGSGGMWPGAGSLLPAKIGVLGTTAFGGTSNLGTLFSLGKSTVPTVINFAGTAGEFPNNGLTMDSNGYVYGTTFFGGDLTCHAVSSGCGVVFKVDPGGKEKVLYSFQGPPDGDQPVTGPVLDRNGNIYGATAYGGTGQCQNQPSQGCGMIYEISPTGQETVLYNFTGGADGMFLFGGLIRDSQGNLFGTAAEGGGSGCSEGCGTIFKLTP